MRAIDASQALLGSLAVGDVVRGGEDADDAAEFIPVDGGVVQDGRDAAIAVTDFQGVIAHRAFVEDSLVPQARLLRLGEVIGEVRPDDLAAGESCHSFGGRVDISDLAVGTDGDQRVGAGLDQAAIVGAGLRTASSACFRSVMSRAMQATPTIAPVSSRSGESVRETEICRPSFLLRIVSK